MPTMPYGCIPPQVDPATGNYVCPIGFTLDPTGQFCCPNSTAPVNMQDPTIRALVTGLPDVAIDPHQNALLSAEGFKDSNIIERFIVALLEIPLKIISPLITLGASIADDALTVLANAFLAAQGEHASGYYRLAGALMTDMLGIEVDGDALANTFLSGGRIAAMRALGGKVVDTLAGEFLGVAQGNTGNVFTAPAGQGIAGLPAIPLSPEQGLAGLRSFVGFMTAFAIREGNTDFLASMIPHGYGEVFKDFAEDFAKNLGIGRLGRMAWKPLVTTTVAQPAQWALNKQYRPTQLTVTQAFRALLLAGFEQADLTENLQRHGYADALQTVLQWEAYKKPTRPELRALHTSGKMADQDYQLWSARDYWTPEVVALLDQAEDIALPLRAVHGAASKAAENYLLGKLTRTAYEQIVDSLAKGPTGTVWLSDQEVSAFKDLPVIGIAGAGRHLGVAQQMRLFLDGITSLQEFESALSLMGFDQATVTEETQEVLLMQKRLSDKAARSAAAAQRGPLWHLSVAQLEAGLTQGLVKDADLRAELAVRHYTPAAVNDLVSEMYAKAKIPPPTPPTS